MHAHHVNCQDERQLIEKQKSTYFLSVYILADAVSGEGQRGHECRDFRGTKFRLRGAKILWVINLRI